MARGLTILTLLILSILCIILFTYSRTWEQRYKGCQEIYKLYDAKVDSVVKIQDDSIKSLNSKLDSLINLDSRH